MMRFPGLPYPAAPRRRAVSGWVGGGVRAVLAACLLVSAACGGGGDGPTTQPLPPFYALATVPADGSVQIDLAPTVYVRFNKAVDTNTVEGGALSVTSIGGVAMAGTVSVVQDGADDRLRWTPIHDLAVGQQHVVEIDAALRSVDGEPLGGRASFRFVTRVADPGNALPSSDQLVPALGRLGTGRQGHEATLLADGRVLITGGFTVGGATTASVEVYRETTQQFTPLASSMTRARAAHTATRLADGRVLLAGGWFEGSPGINATTASAEMFDPLTDTFAAVGDMTVQRADHAALLLPDGRVLLTGGSRLVGSFLEDHATAEVFDPTTGTFQALPGALAHTRSTHGMAYGPSGTIVLGGGSDVDFEHGSFDADLETFSALPAAFGDRARFGPAVAAFESRGVLIAGGDRDGTVLYVHPTFPAVLNTGSALSFGRSYATAMRIKPDQILVAGGIDFGRGGFIESSCDVIVEGGVNGANTFSAAVRFTTGMAHHAACFLPSGDILFCGGLNEDGAMPNKRVAFVFDVR